MTNKTTQRVNPIGINWPISHDELSKMNKEQLSRTLEDAQASYETKADAVLDLVNKIQSPFTMALRDELFRFVLATQWQMVVGEHYLRQNAQPSKPDDRG